MLFNSFEFIFIFLPSVFSIYFLIFFLKTKIKNILIIYLLIIASLTFYSYWKIEYLFLILFSISINFILSKLILNKINKKIFLIIGIVFNVTLLSYFKYYDFLIFNLNEILELNISYKNIILPLAISFFTFQQIAFLVDCFRGLNSKYSFINYLLFVTSFPQLIAGPIVHHSEVMPQFNKLFITKNIIFKNLTIGLSIFIIGLFKKVVFADNLSLLVDPVFDNSEIYSNLTIFQAWLATLSYGLQIYFDFSGYSDMAIGLGRIFGIKLPKNFNSPYKSFSIIEFWKRWHITLSRFINEYLFNPLALYIARKSFFINNLFINNLSFIFFPAVITFSISGLWHGASWNFVIWGLLHSFYIIINSVFKNFNFIFSKTIIFKYFSILLTYVCVNIAWVPFRARDLESFTYIFKSLFGLNNYAIEPVNYLKDINILIFLLIPLSYIIIFFFKNSKDYFENIDSISAIKFDKFSGMIISILAIILLIFGNLNSSPFIYFNF